MKYCDTCKHSDVLIWVEPCKSCDHENSMRNWEPNEGYDQMVEQLSDQYDLCEYERWMKYWKEQLGLQDWVIFLRVNCEESELQTESTFGEVEWTLGDKSAVIRLLDPAIFGEDPFIVPVDMEKTLVHELLHLKFAVIQSMVKTDAEYDVMHVLIDDMARGMVGAKRGVSIRPESGKRFIDRKVDL